MTEVSIRSARPSDIEAARSVLGAAYSQYEAMFPAENWGPYLADILDVEGRFAVSELLIAERIGGIVGCVSFYPLGARCRTRRTLFPSTGRTSGPRSDS